VLQHRRKQLEAQRARYANGLIKLVHEAQIRPGSVPPLDPNSIRTRRISDGATSPTPSTGETLFERVRPSNGQILRCELRCCRDSGWELRFFSHSSLLCSYGGFEGRASAVRFAERLRKELDDVVSVRAKETAERQDPMR
jgi:hypothetical protein